MLHRTHAKQKQGKMQNFQFYKTLNVVAKDELRQNRLDFLMLANQVDTLCDQIVDVGLPDGQTQK